MNFYTKISSSIIVRSFQVFTRADRRKLFFVSLIQVALGFLDLLGVGFIGLLGALTVSGIQSQTSEGRIYSALRVIGIENLSFQTQVAILGTLATLVFVIRTLCSIYFTRRILHFLALRTAITSNKLVSKLLNLPPLELQKSSTQELMYAISNGINNITVGIVGTCLTLIADTSIFLVLSSALFIVDPILALASMALFTLTAFLLYKRIQVTVRDFGAESTRLSIQNSEKVLEVLTSYRETIVRGRRDYYIEIISNYRKKIAIISAELSFLPNISKYVLETLLVVGSLGMCAIQFLTQDALHAISVLAVFLAAGSRIAPAVLRVQQGAVQIKSNAGSSAQTLALIEELDWSSNSEVSAPIDQKFEYPDFEGTIEVNNLYVQYPSNLQPTLKGLDLNIAEGEIVAIVGPSGSGKTTLIDTMLGLIPPSNGTVLIGGIHPLDVIKKWPGVISYVPQNVSIVNGSILENITLGYPETSINMSRVLESIEISQLTEFIEALPDGMQTEVGEFGSRISGGQRQRLGIARALYSNPKLLVLDEATSALDAITEERFGVTLQTLAGKTTIILIAHRLSTVRHSQKVVYLENGFIKSVGSFEDVSREVPDFNRAANFLDTQ